MTYFTPIVPPIVRSHTDVITLRCPELLHFDPGPLHRLVQDKDHVEVEELICRILEDIAQQLHELQLTLEACDFAAMPKPARRVLLVAEQVGLTEVAIAAQHVLTCVDQEDGVALQATLARLERGFDVAVAEVWNFREIG